LANAIFFGPDRALSTLETTCGLSSAVRVTGTARDRPMSAWFGGMPRRAVTWRWVLGPLDQWIGTASAFAFMSERLPQPAAQGEATASVAAEYGAAWGSEELAAPSIVDMRLFLSDEDDLWRGLYGSRCEKPPTAKSLFQDVVFRRALAALETDSGDVDPGRSTADKLLEEWRRASRPSHIVPGPLADAPLTMAALKRTQVAVSSWQRLMFRRLVAVIPTRAADELVAKDLDQLLAVVPAPARRSRHRRAQPRVE
jgi:hypothetical protein